MKEAMRSMQGLFGADCGGGRKQPQCCFPVGWIYLFSVLEVSIQKKVIKIQHSSLCLCEMGSETAPALIGYPV